VPAASNNKIQTLHAGSTDSAILDLPV